MLGRFTTKTWLAVGGAVVAVAIAAVLVAVLAADDDDGGEVATDTTASTSSTTTRPTTTGPETTSTIAASGTGPGTTPCPDLSPPGEVLGRTDLDGDDVDELFVRTGSGVRDTVALFRVDECEAVAVTLDSAPAEFAVGASVGATGGLQCGEGPSGTIRVYAGESADGETYDITWRDLRLAGTTLTQVDAGSATAHAGDELVTKASTFVCG